LTTSLILVANKGHLEDSKFCPEAGAPMRAEVRRFFRLAACIFISFVWHLTSTAYASDVCLISPREGEPVWVRTQSGDRTDEVLQNHTLAQIQETSGQSESPRAGLQMRYYEVFVNGESKGWVSRQAIHPPEYCNASDPDPDSTPTVTPPPVQPPSQPSSPLQSNLDPFQCRSSRNQDLISCNKESIRNYATQGKHNFSYDQAREELFQVVDVVEPGQGNSERSPYVASLYSKETIPVPNHGMPDSNSFNTEHVFPQSRLRKNAQTFSQSRTDLFHLFACSSWINSKRSSLPFANVSGGTPVGESEMTDSSFEPPNRSKGKVARAMMYIALVYGLSIASSEEQTLRSWHTQFPVDSSEIERSARVTEIQGNKNPFVDHPEWSDLISDF
jgi:hypothetical protein